MLVLSNSLAADERFFAPHLAASAAVLAFSLDTGVFRLERRGSGVLGALGLALLGTALAVLGPSLGRWPPPWPSLLAILATTAVVTLANAAIELRDPEALGSRDWTAWRFLLSFSSSMFLLSLASLLSLVRCEPRSPWSRPDERARTVAPSAGGGAGFDHGGVGVGETVYLETTIPSYLAGRRSISLPLSS